MGLDIQPTRAARQTERRNRWLAEGSAGPLVPPGMLGITRLYFDLCGTWLSVTEFLGILQVNLLSNLRFGTRGQTSFQIRHGP